MLDPARLEDMLLKVLFQAQTGHPSDQESSPVDTDRVTEVGAGLERKRVEIGGKWGVGGQHGGDLVFARPAFDQRGVEGIRQS